MASMCVKLKVGRLLLLGHIFTYSHGRFKLRNGKDLKFFESISRSW